MNAVELRDAITEIFAERSKLAAQSEYDKSVCIRAVAAARDRFLTVAVTGDAIKYGQSVLQTLTTLRKTYNDSDGKYTSGKGSIGDVLLDVTALIENSQGPDSLH